MSSLFSKFTGSAIQLAKQGSAQIISSVNKAKSVIAENLTAVAAPAAPVTCQHELTKVEELDLLFREVCEIIDQLAVLPDANTIEMDARLNHTEIRVKLRKFVEILQLEAQIWLVNQRSIADRSDDELHISETPCLDHFLQLNMVFELCNRSMSDKPRGILRLTLTTLSTIFRQIPYPLLPHQAVYRPVAKIIFIASRYEAFIQQDVIVRKSVADKEKYVAFNRRMEISLTSLLRTIWRKIVENPPCLDYFIVADRRTSSVDQYVESSRALPKMQIDVLSSLLPLLHNPKVGQYAQESVLIALNIRDTRVDFYLAYNTGFTFSLVRNVCDDFNAALQFLQKQLTSNSNIIIPTHLIPFCSQNAFGASHHVSNNNAAGNKSSMSSHFHPPPKPITPSSSRASLTPSSSSGGGILGFFPAETPKDLSTKMQQEQNQRQQKKIQEEETYNAVSQFLNSLTFLRAVFNSLQGRESRPSNTRMDDSSNTAGDDVSSTGIQHCLQRLSDTYYAEFIQGCLHSAIDSSNEVQNSAVYILLKLLLSHLAWSDDSDRDSSDLILSTNRRKLYDRRQRSHLTLLGETLNFLLYQPSTAAATPASAAHTSTRPFRPSEYYRSIVDRSTSMSKSLSSSANMLHYAIISTVPPMLGLQLLNHASSPAVVAQSKASTSSATAAPSASTPQTHFQALPFDINPLTFDDALSRCCTVMEMELSKEKQLPPASMVLAVQASQLSLYTEQSTHHLLRKLFHRGDDILRYTNTLSITDSAVGATASDTMLTRTLKRLHAFSSLRIDEQVTLSGIVNEISCLLCTSMLLSPGKQAKDYLIQFYTLLKKINNLRTELNGIVRQIPEVRKKMLMMKEHLQEEAVYYVTVTQDRVDVSSHMTNAATEHGSSNQHTTGPAHNNSKPMSSISSRRKLVESETMQYKQLMTSGIILQEMEHEILGYLFATKSVARKLHDPQHDYLQRNLDPSTKPLDGANMSAAEICFAEAMVDTKRVDEEEFRWDVEEMENYRRLLQNLDGSSSSASAIASGVAKGYCLLNLEKTEQDFMKELAAVEESIDALIISTSLSIEVA